MNNITSSTGGDVTFTDGDTANLVFTGTTDATNDTFTFNLDYMLDWLPEACKWKKYFPAWHLVRSYRNA